MHEDIDQLVLDIAEYMIEYRQTVRGAAKHFGCSKSTVHKYMTERLEPISPSMYIQVREILDKNKAERHIRGGLATKRKYKGEG